MEDLRGKALKAYDALFNYRRTVEIDGRVYRLEHTSVKGLRRFSVGGYDFIEQNPDKGSRWGEMAREGHRILWVMRGGSYLAQVRDGVFHDFRERG